MKKLTEFESLNDFGFKSELTRDGKIKYIKCDSDFESVSDLDGVNNVYPIGDISTGKFFTLNDILSGGTLNVTTDDADHGDQASLALDYNLATSLAFLGSVYSTTLIGINKIKDTYPNGFSSSTVSTGVGAIYILNSNTYTYGLPPFSVTNYTDYELIQLYNGAYDSTFAINSATTATAHTYSFIFLDGTPSNGVGFTHAVQPKTSTLDKFYSTLTPYELNLLQPPFDRSNYFPRDPIATNNVLFDGASYDTFLETELEWATSADTHEANFIWRKLYPDGQKTLDSDDDLMQKMVLTISSSFDTIKRYQDQLKFQQTIGYGVSDHISKDLVENLANQWNWTLGHNLKQDDYSEYIYSQYTNYITGQSQQKLNAKDVNFEMWRRVLANIVTLYKKKGTIEAIKYVCNMYGIPEELLWIDELVQIKNGNATELIESESNIVVPMSGSSYYIDENGSAKTLTYNVISNTKYLNVNVSPIDAIEYDYFDWGWDNHQDITNINGDVVTVSSTTEVTKRDFFNTIYKNTIKSDGSARYDSNYPLLEDEGEIYYTASTNKKSLTSLEPYMDFLDENWNILITNLVPASSRLMSVGTLYKNPMWNREKIKWSDTELDSKSLPFNETIQFDHVTPTANLIQPKTGTVELNEPITTMASQLTSTLEDIQISPSMMNTFSSVITTENEVGALYQNMIGNIELGEVPSEMLTTYNESIDVDISYSATAYTINSPIITPISGQYGTLDYVNYTSDALVVTNQNEFEIIMSASNLSDSGFTQIECFLYEKEYDDAVIVDDTKVYSIMSVEYESNSYGKYKVSNVDLIDEFDFISIESEYLPFINKIVQVTFIDSGTSQIRTSPSIGLFNLPTGVSNKNINWLEFVSSGALSKLEAIVRYLGLSINEIIPVISSIASLVDGGGLNEIVLATQSINDLGLPDHGRQMFSWFFDQEPGILYGSLLTLEFVKVNESWNLGSPPYSLVNMVALNQTKASFKRVINFFNWRSPVQTISYSNLSAGTDTSDFVFPTINVSGRSEANDFSMSGTVTLGGLNDLNSDILKDKTEYFHKYRVTTQAPLSWGNISGLRYYPVGDEKGSLLDSGYDLSYYNNIKYYGRYFMYMLTPKVPVASIENLDADGVSVDASVVSKWNGVGDSSRLELQYLITGSTVDGESGDDIPTSSWTASAITINVPARENVGDEYIYTIQTTLEADTYYWWRVKNFKSKINAFGHNLEYFSTTRPTIFKTGDFAGGGSNEGETPVEPVTPTQPTNRYGNVSN